MKKSIGAQKTVSPWTSWYRCSKNPLRRLRLSVVGSFLGVDFPQSGLGWPANVAVLFFGHSGEGGYGGGGVRADCLQGIDSFNADCGTRVFQGSGQGRDGGLGL